MFKPFYKNKGGSEGYKNKMNVITKYVILMVGFNVLRCRNS